eukprot:scaffold5586_cov124-Isochrysis_galbana.AAC.22
MASPKPAPAWRIFWNRSKDVERWIFLRPNRAVTSVIVRPVLLVWCSAAPQPGYFLAQRWKDNSVPKSRPSNLFLGMTAGFGWLGSRPPHAGGEWWRRRLVVADSGCAADGAVSSVWLARSLVARHRGRGGGSGAGHGVGIRRPKEHDNHCTDTSEASHEEREAAAGACSSADGMAATRTC